MRSVSQQIDVFTGVQIGLSEEMASFLRDWTGGFFGGEATPSLQSSGMLSKQQLLQLFQDCSAAFENQG
jgi:hypothetical protein